jgi:hypothetical protein
MPAPDENHTTKPEIEIVSDESWKDQVRRENEKLEAEYRSAHPAETGSASDVPAADDRDSDLEQAAYRQLPPPALTSIISMLSTQAMVGLGAFADPEDQSSGPQLDLARHFIDLLGVLEAKTAGNLSADESRLLTSTLHELRMAFVEVSRHESTPRAES